MGDRVAFALLGAVLPGGFEITAAKKYGRVSEGMICAVDELGIGEDHTGILVLPPDTPLGVDFASYAGLRDDVLEITVTPDRGYAVSIRGVARELASAYQVPYTDPADVVPGEDAPAPRTAAEPATRPAAIADPTACDRFVLREVRGFDPAAPTPLWMQVGSPAAGCARVSLAVDVTNYLMLELGQPLHAFDRAKLNGPDRGAPRRPGETLDTLDHVTRDAGPRATSSSPTRGPDLAWPGTMGGLATEIDDDSTDIVIEGAHFSDTGTAQDGPPAPAALRGVLPVRARRRPRAAAARHRAGRRAARRARRRDDRARRHARAVPVAPVTIGCRRLPGPGGRRRYGMDTVSRGCAGRLHGRDDRRSRRRAARGRLRRSARRRPRWSVTAAVLAARPDRPERPGRGGHPARGLREHPRPRCPAPPAGRGPDRAAAAAPPRRPRARRRRLRRGARLPVRSATAAATPGAARRTTRGAARCGWPTRSARTSRCSARRCCPACSRALARNIGRGFARRRAVRDGLVFLPRPGAPRRAPRLAVDRGPTDGGDRRARGRAARPAAARSPWSWPAHRELAGWWGQGRPATWADAIEAARRWPREAGVELEVGRPSRRPGTPGRCAALLVVGDGDESLVGHAGELHPRVIEAFGLPRADLRDGAGPRPCCGRGRRPARARPRTLRRTRSPRRTSRWSWTPAVPAAEVEAALAAGAGELLEDVRLFDVYTGEQVGEGRKSLAYTLRFRAPDRTLTAEEATAARDAAVAEAARRTGAVLRQ